MRASILAPSVLAECSSTLLMARYARVALNPFDMYSDMNARSLIVKPTFANASPSVQVYHALARAVKLLSSTCSLNIKNLPPHPYRGQHVVRSCGQSFAGLYPVVEALVVLKHERAGFARRPVCRCLELLPAPGAESR